MDDQGSLLMPTGFDSFWTFFSLVVALMVLAVVIAVIRSVRMARRGQNPLTLQEDLAYQVSTSSALAPQRTKAERLDEIDVLRDSGRITDEEHAAARARILSE